MDDLKYRLFELGDLFKVLNESERNIVLERFGFTGDSHTLQAVADKFGLSKQRIQQIEVKALEKMQIIINYKK